MPAMNVNPIAGVQPTVSYLEGAAPVIDSVVLQRSPNSLDRTALALTNAEIRN